MNLRTCSNLGGCCAQAHHRFTTTMQRRILGRSTEIEIRPLDEERAIQSASDILGEVFLFSVSGIKWKVKILRSFFFIQSLLLE